jgi:hypothetical protein
MPCCCGLAPRPGESTFQPSHVLYASKVAEEASNVCHSSLIILSEQLIDSPRLDSGLQNQPGN